MIIPNFASAGFHPSLVLAQPSAPAPRITGRPAVSAGALFTARAPSVL